MKITLKRKSNARVVKRMLSNIPLLPSDQIAEGFKSIMSFAKEKKLMEDFDALFSYFQSYWLKQVGC